MSLRILFWEYDVDNLFEGVTIKAGMGFTVLNGLPKKVISK